MNEIITDLLSNYVLVVSFIAWFSAQVTKIILDTMINKRFSSERIIGSGGMPSAHSALVCSMTITVLRLYGLRSPFFAVAFTLACIVMYDAMGVRRASGEQAKVINKLIVNLMDDLNPKAVENHYIFHEKLKELIGHTPLEVLGGMTMGISISLLIPVF
ncbi:MAG: divergent PAP2 family protein [Oscillospiraceae bacterium]